MTKSLASGYRFKGNAFAFLGAGAFTFPRAGPVKRCLERIRGLIRRKRARLSTNSRPGVLVPFGPFSIKPLAPTLQEFVRFRARSNFISFTPGLLQTAAGSVDSYVLLPGPWSTELFLRNWLFPRLKEQSTKKENLLAFRLMVSLARLSTPLGNFITRFGIPV